MLPNRRRFDARKAALNDVSQFVGITRWTEWNGSFFPDQFGAGRHLQNSINFDINLFELIYLTKFKRSFTKFNSTFIFRQNLLLQLTNTKSPKSRSF
jgi:hypothetical protein